MQAVIILMIKRIIAAMVGKRMFLFIAKAVVTRTDNSLDDGLLMVIEGGLNNDEALIIKGGEIVIDTAADLVKEYNEKNGRVESILPKE